MSHPNLTAKQEAFCLAIVSGKNASDALRASYDVSRMKDKTIHEKASALLKNGKVSARIAALRAPVIEEAQVTLEQHLKDLKALRDMATGGEKWAAAVQAEIARGKASGLYVERVEVDAKVNGGVTYTAHMPERGTYKR